MATSHLKRLNAPRTWKIKRRGLKFVTRAKPGPHTMDKSMPLNILMRDMLGHVKTNRDVKTVVKAKDIQVNGKAVSEIRYPVGLFDVLQIPKLGENYRMLLNRYGYLTLVKIDKKEANLFPAKIVGKTVLKGGKMQLNLSAGINMLVEKNNFKTGETLMLDMPSKNMVDHLKLEKGAYVFLSGGSHVGDHGVVEDVKESKIYYKSGADKVFETSRKFVTVVGNQKPMITLSESN